MYFLPYLIILSFLFCIFGLCRFEKIDRPYYELDVSKLRGLGMNFRSIEEMFDDCVQSLINQGHLYL